MKIQWTAPHDFADLENWEWPGQLVFGHRHHSCEVWVVDPLLPVHRTDILAKPNLKLLVTPSTGQNHVPVEFLRLQGIGFRSLLDDREGLEKITASSEYSFLMVLAALRKLKDAAGATERNEKKLRGHELAGKTVGLVGFGRIGRNIARYCVAFGAKTWHYDPYVDGGTPLRHIFAESDVVVVCCSLTSETSGMIGADLLGIMKPNAALVNTSRGEVFIEHDLVTFLRARKDISAAIDVVESEDFEGTELRGLAFLTPHIAGCTYESQQKAAEIVRSLMWQWAKDTEVTLSVLS